MVLARYILILVIYTFIFTPSYSQTDHPTTFFFVRHVEKVRDGSSDPDLNAQGILRSENWAHVFKNTGIDAIYSTDTKRTIKTAEPTASSNNLNIEIYNAQTIDIVDLAKAYQGKSVLIVGHSNSTPTLVNQLLEKDKYPQIEDNNNGNLYVVTIINSISTCVLLHID